MDVNNLKEEGKVVLFNLTKDLHVIHMDYYNYIKSMILNHLEQYHKRFPLRIGVLKEEIRSKYLNNAKPLVGEKLIDLLIKEGCIEQRNESLCLKGFEIKYDERQKRIKEDIIDIFRKASFSTPKKEELINKMAYVDEKEVEEVFGSLINSGEIIKLSEDIYLYKENIEKAIALLKEYLDENGFVTVAQFRDILNTNRKTALALLEYFDYLKITKRDGDKRTLATGK